MEKFNKKVFRIIIAVAIIIILFIMLIFDFQYKLNIILEKNAYEFLGQAATLQKTSLTSKINGKFDLLRTLSQQFSSWGDNRTNDIVASMDTNIKNGAFSSMYIADTTGLSFSYSGVALNVWEREYYQKALSGNETISNPINSLLDGKKVISFAVPIYEHDNIKGVLVGVIDIDSFDEILTNNTDENSGVSFIVNDFGDFITTHNYVNFPLGNDNLLNFLGEVKIHNNTNIDNIKENLTSNQPGFVYYEYAGQFYYVTYKSLGINDWSIFVTVGSDAISHQEKDINWSVLFLAIKLILIFLLLIVYIIVTLNRKNKTISLQSHLISSAKKELEALVSNIPSGIFKYSADENGTFDFISGGVLDIWGNTVAEYRMNFHNSYYNTIYEPDLDQVKPIIEQTIKQKSSHKIQYRIVDKHGEIRWVHSDGKYVADEFDNGYIYASLTDITETKEDELKLKLSEERYRILAVQSNNILFDYDVLTKKITHSDNFYEKFSRNPPTDNFPQSAVDGGYIHPDDVDKFLGFFNLVDSSGEIKSSEYRIIDSHGNTKWFKITITTLVDSLNIPIKVIGKLTDIDKQKRHVIKLTEMAQIDLLTGLLNKVSATQIISGYLNDDERSDGALLAIDLDGFKNINDTLGHPMGDKVLQDFAKILKKNFRSTDILSRFGGDEFTAFIKDIPDKNFVCKLSQRIIDELQKLTFGDVEKAASVSASIGIYYINSNQVGFLTAYHGADSALYEAKAAGKSCYKIYVEEEYGDE